MPPMAADIGMRDHGHGGRRPLWAAAAAVCLSLLVHHAPVAAQKLTKDQETRRPKLTLRIQPSVATAPARVTFTAELTGGADDFEQYYCPTIAWEWGDDTTSENTSDCEPYEAGRSQVKRRYTTQHQFRRAGSYKVYFQVKQKDRIVGSATSTLQVQAGLSEFD